MKRVLVITLVLVMAFASSAMAAVTFREISPLRLKWTVQSITKPYTLEPKFGVTIGASNENKTDDVVNWDFSLASILLTACLNLENTSLACMMIILIFGFGVTNRN